ncbi:FecR domain-containing protein [Chitinophaga sp. MM2321]|uniref:FecR family protein n=1 Tax=Chitinophaga sp. MM2321 TaxID=3137178 RepID=UPI0032D579F3
MDRYLADEADNEEWMELAAMIRTGHYDTLLQHMIDDIYEAEDGTVDMTPMRRQELFSRICAMDDSDDRVVAMPRRRDFTRWWAAASILVLAVAGAAYFFFQKGTAPVPGEPVATQIDIAPGSNKALLTLSDGTVVALDSTGNQLIRQGNIAIRQQNGELQYATGKPDKNMGYNTLTTPKGGQYRLVLPDGTGVWLNAASSIRYPVAFTGNERRVELSGEAYFEVVHNEKKPFRILANNQLIEDLGTQFNVNAYTEEPEMKTTLLEGSVKVGGITLKPGEQARVNKKGETTLLKNVNVADAVAWKNGFFVFRDDNLKTVMRQLSRWYDVEIIYPPDVNNKQQFSGRIDRSLTLAQVLNGLAQTKAHFSIEANRKVIILP